MKPIWRKVLAATALLALLLGLFPVQSRPAQAVSGTIVISQVYGGGGNSNALYTNDFVELFNRGTSPVSIEGWSIQYASATGSGFFSLNTVLISSGTLQPGQYFLIQLKSNGMVGSPLPAPDATGTVDMSASSGKVILANTSSGLTCNGSITPCSADQLAQIMDLVGYGTATFFEGQAAAPGTSNTTAVIRNSSGCAETDDNAADFTAGAPAPRNTISPVHNCSVDSAPSVSATSPANGAALPALAGNITVTFSEAVDAAATAFSLSCTTNGSLNFSLSGGPTTFTLDPDVSFVDGETCTVTVNAAQVTDQDTNDPPDAMLADYTFTFTAVDACIHVTNTIPAIQGSGAAVTTTAVQTTKGVVTADYEGASPALGGFFIQDPGGDGDPATSDGIFVYNGSNNSVAAGDLVSVTGAPEESFNQSQIRAASVVKCGTGMVTPTDVSLPFESAAFPERYEGMLVRLPQPLVIAEYFNYDRFGEIVLSLPLDGETRPFTGTAVEAPGAAANARIQANSLRRITLDDANNAQNPPALRHPNGQPFSLTNRFRGGDTVQNTLGILGYAFNLYRIFPTGPAEYTATNPRPASPEPLGGMVRVAAMNTLNFFVTANYPSGDPLDNKCGPANTIECRGWDSDQLNEFTRQREKLLAALAALNADVIGLNELENSAGVEPLESIVSGLPGYQYIAAGVLGTDAIKVGLIYRSGVVTPVGTTAVLQTSDFLTGGDTTERNRPALAQAFQVVANGPAKGQIFIVVVNHLKSKGSACDVPDAGDGQGACSIVRTNAAKDLMDWLAGDPTGTGDPDILLLGDYNSYAMEDPITAIQQGADDTAGTADDFTNLIEKYQGRYAYSYTFDGQAGYLDHALASSTMLKYVTGAAEWHINSDEPDILDYDTSFKPDEQDALYEPNAYRTSDHDPVVVGLNLAPYRLHMPVIHK